MLNDFLLDLSGIVVQIEYSSLFVICSTEILKLAEASEGDQCCHVSRRCVSNVEKFIGKIQIKG